MVWGAGQGYNPVCLFQEIGVLQIEPGVPLPTDRTKYPFRDMEPGDSILFKDQKQSNSARVAALRFVRVHQPRWQFRLRRVDNGWRLWRVS